jgi:hypothetical protein
MVIMSTHSQTRRVTYLTLIDARVVSGFMKTVSESYGIVPKRRLIIYELTELINVNTYIYLLKIKKD